MSVKCHEVITKLEQLAPKHLAEDWDNIGLLVGSPEQTIHKIMITLDVDQTAINQAITVGADMIVSHHPVLFKGITNIRTDSPLGSMLFDLIKNKIAVYAAHTNLDSAPGGVNDILAQKFQLKDSKPLSTVYQEKLYKLVVFVPASHVEKVRIAMSEAGAGHIGNYSHCTFQTKGVGTFLPLAATTPFIGREGQLEFVDESRIETIVPSGLRCRVINAMLAAHPYEEVAYDEYLLQNKGPNCGLGRIGRLGEAMSLRDFSNQVKHLLMVNSIKVAGSADTVINQVAVCGGSGASLIKNAIKAGADVLVTGDVKYHEAQQALMEGLAIIDAGHFATEQPVVQSVAAYLDKQARENGWAVEMIANNSGKDVFTAY
ncbi:Nif3-like dinuclear metal center hexameric protein [Sporomusa sp. KB1]|jgi:dinuclear metal center YbgI/SA1388 family protein|uniref:Nif3-like dinuclear metal center hexameric protein n=1 Tax=Sporomusa sp. KB1 TaxID=943346 RepID=UPI00119CC7FB|nr:Nif3-like dinuclear metal center hexameric protein [Sporomusa sp. KB1]TWH48835.1 dinuclear metal center YbgI/SA1388 family protein [Sporomusa sp. KB1]